MPFAGLLESMMASKFEWQFKYRDEADVNAGRRDTRGVFKKSPIGGHFCDSSDSVYRRDVGTTITIACGDGAPGVHLPPLVVTNGRLRQSHQWREVHLRPSFETPAYGGPSG
jgi:hypothetical protein